MSCLMHTYGHFFASVIHMCWIVLESFLATAYSSKIHILYCDYVFHSWIWEFLQLLIYSCRISSVTHQNTLLRDRYAQLAAINI